MAIGRPISLTPNIATKNISSLATADQTEFTVTGGYRINEIAVYRNGVRLAEGRDFTASDGDTVNLVTAASDADVIEFAVFDSFSIADAIVGAASSQNVNGDLNVTGIFYAGDFKTDGVTVSISTVSSTLHVGTALTAYAAGDIETIGIITAASFKGDGSGLTGIGETVNVRTNTITVSGVSTFTGAVNVDATTDSTSSSTGALIVDGGLGVAKNVYIGAGLSVAGTLTYEDVTSVDSVGLITAKSGVNITGGELTVGSGITMGIAGVATFSGTGDVHLLDNVRLNVGDASDLAVYHAASANYITGTPALNIQSGTSISLKSTGGDTMLLATPDGAVTAYYDNSAKLATTKFGTITTGIATATEGDFTSQLLVGSGITFGSAGVSTFSGTADVHLTDGVRLNIGDGSDHALYHDGTQTSFEGTVPLYIKGSNVIIYKGGTTDKMLQCTGDGASSLWYSASKKIETTNDGVVVTGIATVSQGLNTDGLLSEKFETTAGKLSDNTNIDLEDGMVHYFSTQETTTSTPNIRYSSSKSLNNMLSTGDSISVTIITTAASAGYSAQLTIDGSAVTEEWVGGSAPSAGGSGGFDIYAYTILKTGSGAYKVIANLTNAA